MDYNDEAALISALRGQQCLVITLSVLAPPDTHDKLAAAAAKAGVPYVMPNCFGTDFTHEALRHENLNGEKVLADIASVQTRGVSAWLALVCGSWYEYSLAVAPDTYGIDIRGRKVTFFDDGKTKISASTWKQCGRAVAALLSLKERPGDKGDDDDDDDAATLSRWANGPVFVASFLVSQRDMLDSIHRILATTDADWKIDYEPSAVRYEKAIE